MRATSASDEQFRERIHVTQGEGTDGTYEALTRDELVLLRNGGAAIGARLGLGNLQLVAASDSEASVFLVERTGEAMVLAAPPDPEKLGDRIAVVESWLEERR